MSVRKTSAIVETINGLRLRLSGRELNLAGMECGRRRWLAPKDPAAMWELLAVDVGGRRVFLTGGSASRTGVRRQGESLELFWRGVRDAATGAGPFDVTVTIAPHAGTSGATAWRIAVANRSRRFTLWQVEFPRLEGLTASADRARDRQFYGDCWGAEYRGAKMHAFRLRYPRGIKIASQYYGYTRGRRTLYLGVHDPRLTTKELVFQPPGRDGGGGRMAVVTYPEDMSVPGNGLAAAYDTVVADVAGDWYDASMLYAQWARRQAWAAVPPAQADPAPRASREVHAWLAFQVPEKPARQWALLARRLARRLGVRMGVHFYNWHQVPFDTDYPDYFPPRPGFKGLVAAMNREGIVTMPYINARLWDINAPSWRRRRADRYAAQQSSQRVAPLTLEPFLEEYGNGQKLAPMCPATEFWQKTVADLCRRIVRDLGCRGVYLDQVAAERAELCFEPAHGHPLGGGGWWLDGYRRMMGRIRHAVGPKAYLTTEANWEGCIADYDSLLCYFRFGDEMVPMFPAVYAGLARTFGCSFNRHHINDDGGEPFACRMAMLFVWGAQLGWGDLTRLLEPRHKILCDYFVSLCRLREAHVDLLANGRFLRPPRVRVLDGAPASAGRYPVYASVWAGANGTGRRVCFVVNPRRLAQRVRLTLTDVPRRGRPEELTVRLEPFSAAALELTGRKGQEK